MAVIVSLQVDGVDLDNDATLNAVGEHLADALWQSVDGTVVVDLEISGQRIVEAVLEFADKVHSVLPGAQVRRVRQDFVSASEVANRTGFSRESVRKWSASKRGFPCSVGSVGGSDKSARLWLWPEVAEWLMKTYQYPIERNWADENTLAHIDVCLTRQPDTSPHWRNVGAVPNIFRHGYARPGRVRLVLPALEPGNVSESSEMLPGA